MERRVMKLLGGNRVPMSGAGTLKGDGFVYRSFGLFLVECKLSAAVHGKTGEARIVIDTRWLTKIASEAKSMRAKFGALVAHLHGDWHDYVIISKEKYQRYFPDTLPDEPVHVFTALRVVVAFTRSKLDLIRDKEYARLDAKIGTFYVIHIQRFLELLDSMYLEELEGGVSQGNSSIIPDLILNIAVIASQGYGGAE